MSRFSRITFHSLEMSSYYAQQLRTAMSKAAVADNYDQIMENLAGRVREVAIAHYAHAVGVIGQLIWEAGWLPAGVETGGAQSIKFRRFSGTMGTVRTKVWPALGEAYVVSEPFSTQFWRKFSNASFSLGAAMAKEADPSKARVKITTAAKQRSHHKDRVNAYIDMEYMGLESTLTETITKPFATRAASDNFRVPAVKGQPRVGMQRLFPELNENRPFMRLVAAKLGEDMRAKLRKL